MGPCRSAKPPLAKYSNKSGDSVIFSSYSTTIRITSPVPNEDTDTIQAHV